MGGNPLGVQKNPIRSLIGEADIDVSVADYTAYILLMTIANEKRRILEDVDIWFDLDKATTGFADGYTTETLRLAVARKIDGTNYRVGTDAGEETTAITGTNANALESRSAHLRIGAIGPTEDVQIFAVLSAEQADVELPYVIYYRGQTPTVTPVAAA